ncbi:mannose-1-phosphate guanyltransferase, partial [Lobosporangium transversale]
VTKVEEPSKYGVIVNKPESSMIDRFVEKPVEFVGNKINAGFWMDVGQPKDFLTGTCLYLSNVNKVNPGALANPNSGYVHGGNVLVDPTAKIGKDCRIGPNVVIGPGVVIGDGVRLQRCVLLEGSSVKDFAWIKNSIVGWHSTIGRWARLEGTSVLGDYVTVKDEVYINGGSILPHKSISSNITEPQIIM